MKATQPMLITAAAIEGKSLKKALWQKDQGITNVANHGFDQMLQKPHILAPTSHLLAGSPSIQPTYAPCSCSSSTPLVRPRLRPSEQLTSAAPY